MQFCNSLLVQRAREVIKEDLIVNPSTNYFLMSFGILVDSDE